MDLVKGSVDALVLAVLARGDAHGYRIAQALRDGSDGVSDLPEGTIYPALHRLERRGLVSSRWAGGGRPAPARVRADRRRATRAGRRARIVALLLAGG